MEFGNVPISVPTLRKRLLAVHAVVRPLPRVNPHVHFQLVLPHEAFAAARADVRSVPRVVALVHLQLRQPAVSPAALAALVAGPHLHVLLAVEPQAARRPEGLGALQAAVGFLSGVRGDVDPEAGSRREAAAADGTKVRPLSGVERLVLLQFALVQEGPAADGAAERLFALVRPHVFSQLAQCGEGVVTPSTRVRSLPFELAVLEAVQLQRVLVLERLHAAVALVRPLFHVRPQVILESDCGGEGERAVRTFGFAFAVDLDVAHVVGQLRKVLVAQQTVEALLALVALLVLAACVLHLKLLAASLAGVRVLVDLRVRLQVFGAAERCVTFQTFALVLLGVTLQVSAQVIGEGKLLRTVRAEVTLVARLLVVAH